MNEPSIAAEILRCAPESRRLFMAAGATLAVWSHALLVLLMVLGPARRHASPPPRAMRVEALEYAVDLPPAPNLQRGALRSAQATDTASPIASSSASAKPVPAPPAAAPGAAAQSALRPAPSASKAAAVSGPAAPAPSKSAVSGVAALEPRVSKAAAPPDEVADFTQSGAPAYVGGTQTAPGAPAAATPAVGVPQGSRHGGGSMARSVGLAATEWHCPWPADAESLPIDSQVVVLRAVVNGQGQPLHVTLLTDPGHGFGAAALTCAQSATFEPARDEHGAPYAATSPPIRVTFTREHL